MPLFHDKWVLSFKEIQILAPKLRAYLTLTAHYTTLTKHSNFVSIHIWFVTNMRQEQTLCITLDLIWRKQQVGGKIAFYFQTKTCCLLKTKSNVCNLKKVFLSRKTCSNAAHQLVDGLLLLCKVMKARYHYVYQHNDRLKINLHSLH